MHAFRHRLKVFGPSIVLSALVLCSTLTAKPQWKTYRSKAKNFSVSVPVRWQIRENVLGAAFLAISPAEGPKNRFRENLNIVVGDLHKPIALKNYVALNVTLMKKIFTDFKIVKIGRARLGNDDSQYIIYTHRMKSLQVKVLLYFLTRGLKGYAITCSALPTTFARIEPTFLTIVKTFRANTS